MRNLSYRPGLLPGESDPDPEPIPEEALVLAEQMFGLDSGEMRTLYGYGVTLTDLLERPFHAVRAMHQEIEEIPEDSGGLAKLFALYTKTLTDILYKLERIPLSMH